MTFTAIFPVSGEAKGRLTVRYSVDQRSRRSLTQGGFQSFVRFVAAEPIKVDGKLDDPV
jgi:hypothetical protein